MKNKFLIFITLLAPVYFFSDKLFAFCGFYVARADATLYNNASRVVLVRNEDKTVITMMNDYQGELKDFAIVVPVPFVLKKNQIKVGDGKVVDHLDAFTAPRLVEYFNSPCDMGECGYCDGESPRPRIDVITQNKKDDGVKVEATYTIGEYDIKILSAKFSDGLEEWLTNNGYKIPKGASSALKPYIQQKQKFFVAKVNLKKQAQTGLKFLRPIQFAFNSEKFMLPIRLGMINAKGPQELFVYVLTKNGRVETTNYRTVKLPSEVEVPEFVKQDFSNFYKSMFDYQLKKENYRAVFTEHFWDMSWCDPCAVEPLSKKELRSLGVFWMDKSDKSLNGRTPTVMVTRLHLKYTSDNFPEDLFFQETNDNRNFQSRYIIQHPWEGEITECYRAKSYFENLPDEREKYAQNLARLTGWDIKEIRLKMNIKEPESLLIELWNNIWD